MGVWPLTGGDQAREINPFYPTFIPELLPESSSELFTHRKTHHLDIEISPLLGHTACGHRQAERLSIPRHARPIRRHPFRMFSELEQRHVICLSSVVVHQSLSPDQDRSHRQATTPAAKRDHTSKPDG